MEDKNFSQENLKDDPPPIFKNWNQMYITVLVIHALDHFCILHVYKNLFLKYPKQLKNHPHAYSRLDHNVDHPSRNRFLRRLENTQCHQRKKLPVRG